MLASNLSTAVLQLKLNVPRWGLVNTRRGSIEIAAGSTKQEPGP